MSILVKVAESLDEFKLALQIRRQVFVEEHRVPEEIEADQYDHVAVHFLAWDGKKEIGTGRLRWTDLETAKVERVAVQKEYRHSGTGKKIMEVMEQYAREKGTKKIVLHAPLEAVPFYEKIGYQKEGAPFVEGIREHLKLFKLLE